MVVYGEYLFLQNFITGLLLLYLTARMAGPDTMEKLRLWRLVAGGAACGISGFLLFLPVPLAAGIALRAAVAAGVTAIALGSGGLLRKTGIFLILTVISGGAAMAIFFWMQVPALSGNGVLYVEAMTYGKLLLCGIPAIAFVCWFVKLVRRHRIRQKTTGQVELELEGRVWKLEALVDSGNCLREPMTGKPVILIDEKGSKAIGFCEETWMQSWPQRLTLIPYEAVGTKKGLLQGIRLDRMAFGTQTVRGVVMARYEGRFPGFEVLLNQEILEEGLVEHA